MVGIHRVSAGNVNCYIVVGKDKAILIDTGRKKYREKILDKCKEYHVSLIVLTHGHMDHCQNAAYLANALNIPVAMNKKDLNMIPDNRKQKMSAKTLLGKTVLLVSLSSFEKDTLDRNRKLNKLIELLNAIKGNKIIFNEFIKISSPPNK